MRTLRTYIALASMLAPAACDNAPSGPGDRVASVTVTPQTATLPIGETTTLQAVVNVLELSCGP